MRKPEAIHEKVIEIKDLLQKIAVWRFKNYKIVFTNGCFDILHKGHTWLLNKASGIEDKTILILGLNSDASVKRLKGESRPINNIDDRAYVLSSLYAIDAIIIFEEDTPYELIKMIKPDILVKGGDYKEDQIVGADIVKANGGRIEIVPFLDDHSTTNTISRLAD